MMHTSFDNIANNVSHLLGSKTAFVVAAGILITWLALGVILGFPEILINGGNIVISIVTLFALFLLQNSSNRDSAALHLKLDELLRSNADAKTELGAADSLDLLEIERLRTEIQEEDGKPSLSPESKEDIAKDLP